MRHHAVIRPDAPAVNVPGSEERFKGLEEAEGRIRSKRRDDLLHLGDGREKTEEDPARPERRDGMGNHKPGFRQIQDQPVYRPILDPLVNILKAYD